MRGHTGIVKIMTAELTDETNVAQGFSMLPMAWSIGSVIGFVIFLPSLSFHLNSLSPLIGGVLSRPQDRWPHIFSHPFWADYPYFLPCLVAATFTCLSIIRCGILSGRGLLLPVLEKGSALTAPRHWIRGFRRSFSGRVPTLILLTEKLVIVRIQIQYQMNRTNRFHCARSSRNQSSFLLPITPCSRSLTL